MDKNMIITLKEYMQKTAQRVGLKVYLENEGDFIQIQLLDNNNTIIYAAYEVSDIIAFIHGLESEYRHRII